MEDLFQDGMEEFVRYEKNQQGKKSRQQKKKQKIQKLTADLNDPLLRRERHALRRKQDKAKLQKQLEGMTEEQARVYLDNRREVKKLVKEKILKALDVGLPILIDAVFEEKMNDKQNKSLAIQIQLIMKSIKHIEDPPGIHLCSVGGGLKAQLEKMRYEYWTLTSSAQSVLEVAKRMNKKPIYLSPDAETQLTQIDPNAAYIIGGLVDRTVIKNASLNRANQLQIPAVRLPIRQYMKSRKCLNLDHVVMMICKFKQTNDWKVAFDFGAPKRWKKQLEGQKVEEKNNKKDEQSEEQSIQQTSQKKEEEQEKIVLKKQVKDNNQKQVEECKKLELGI